MPEKAKKEHKCSHHVAAANAQSRDTSWWHNFHFSGKVIMCSVLFGLGLVLIGGLTYAIGTDKTESPNKNDLDEIQNKAPMSIIGPVVMAIGSVTVLVGIIMCLFETSICRRRTSDTKPLIEEQGTSSAIHSSDSNAIPSTSKKSDKHRRHKSRHHKSDKNKYLDSGSVSPSSKPIDVHRSSSRDFTSSENFLTPPSSFAPDNNMIHPNQFKPENESSASLMKSFTSSGKSWNTSSEFKTPSSSFEDKSWSYGNKKMEEESSSSESSDSAESKNTTVENLQHDFLTPQNSDAGLLESDAENPDEETLKIFQNKTHKLSKMNELTHEFVTPIHSYVEKNSFPKKSIEKEILKISPEKNEDSGRNLNQKEKKSQDVSPENNIDKKEFSLKETTGAKDETAPSIMLNNDAEFDKNLMDSNAQNDLPNEPSNKHANDINQTVMADKHDDMISKC